MFLLSKDLRQYGTKTKALRDIVTLAGYLSHGDTSGKLVYPSQACVVHEVGCSPTTLEESLEQLENNGFLRRYYRNGDNDGERKKRKAAQRYVPCRLHKKKEQLHLASFLISGGLFAYMGDGGRKFFMRLLVFHAGHIGSCIPGRLSNQQKGDEAVKRLKGRFRLEDYWELRFVPSSALVGMADKKSVILRLMKLGVVDHVSEVVGMGKDGSEPIDGLVLLLNPHPANILDRWFWPWRDGWLKEWQDYLVKVDLDRERRKSALTRDAELLAAARSEGLQIH